MHHRKHMQHLVLGDGASHAVYLFLDGLRGFVHSLNLLLVTGLLPSQLLQLQSDGIGLLSMHENNKINKSTQQQQILPEYLTLIDLLLLLQLLIERVGFGLGRIELLLRGFQLLLPLRFSILHLVLQHLVLFLCSFAHLLSEAQSALAVL